MLFPLPLPAFTAVLLLPLLLGLPLLKFLPLPDPLLLLLLLLFPGLLLLNFLPLPPVLLLLPPLVLPLLWLCTVALKANGPLRSPDGTPAAAILRAKPEEVPLGLRGPDTFLPPPALPGGPPWVAATRAAPLSPFREFLSALASSALLLSVSGLGLCASSSRAWFSTSTASPEHKLCK